MANPEHVARLKEGVGAWNAWRRTNPGVMVDLESAYLARADLTLANLASAKLARAKFDFTRLTYADLTSSNLASTNFTHANLTRADLAHSNLTHANLTYADLTHANFTHANLTHALLSSAKLTSAKFAQANLNKADLQPADLTHANLTRADLTHANLAHANLTHANLASADLTSAKLTQANLDTAELRATGFSALDLSEVVGLEKVMHVGPSNISTSTLERSKGRIPTAFLRGCGLSDWEVESAKLYNPDLTEFERIDITYRVAQILGETPININPLFISYKREDSDFVDALGKSLDGKRVRYWRDIHDMKAGRIEKQVDRAMRLNPTVLLVLSEKSVESDWVEWEAKKARKLEKELDRDVLCPLSLDDSWKTCKWPERLREQIMEYQILDFSRWQEPTEFQQWFQKLIDGLGLFYPKGKD